MNFSYAFTTLEQLREKQREAAYWLSGRSRLIFDDEPDKYYDAKVFNAVSLPQSRKVTTLKITFECQAFALAANYSHTSETYEETPFILSVISKGNQKTPCIISIKNTGSTNIENLKIIRKARR